MPSFITIFLLNIVLYYNISQYLDKVKKMEEVRDPMARSIDAGSITPQIVRPVKPVRVARPTRATGLASPVQPVKSCQPSNPVPSTVTNNFHFLATGTRLMGSLHQTSVSYHLSLIYQIYPQMAVYNSNNCFLYRKRWAEENDVGRESGVRNRSSGVKGSFVLVALRTDLMQ